MFQWARLWVWAWVSFGAGVGAGVCERAGVGGRQAVVCAFRRGSGVLICFLFFSFFVFKFFFFLTSFFTFPQTRDWTGVPFS